MNVSFDIDAHEYQGRWFNSIRAFDVRQIDPAALGASVAPDQAPIEMSTPVAPPAQEPFSQPSAKEESDDGDLPF